MRQIVKDQINKVRIAKLENYDATTNTFHIKKYKKDQIELHKCYLVKLPIDVVNNPNSTLAINWNSGTFPKTICIKIFVVQINGKMIYVDSLGYDMITNSDLQVRWTGWLDSSSLTILKNL